MAHGEQVPEKVQEHREQIHGRYDQIVAKAWADQSLRQRLLDEPGAVFEQEGIDIPAGVNVQVIENTKENWYFILPGKPENLEGELSDEQLAGVAGGAVACGGCNCDCGGCC